MRASENINEITAALVAARPLFGEIVKSCEVDTGKFKFSYAPFPEIIDKTEQALFHNDLYVIQSDCDGKLVSRLCHSSGQWIENFVNVEFQGGTPQNYGAALTYARRYGYIQLLGICPEDDNESRLEGSNTTVTTTNRFPPKDSKDPRWQGPLNKGELSDAAKDFTAQVESATSLDDLRAMKGSPEFEKFYTQIVHDMPGLWEGQRRFGEWEPGLKQDILQKKKELEGAAEFEARK